MYEYAHTNDRSTSIFITEDKRTVLHTYCLKYDID